MLQYFNVEIYQKRMFEVRQGHLVAGSPKIGTFVPTCLGGVDDRVRQVQRVARVQVEKF